MYSVYVGQIYENSDCDSDTRVINVGVTDVKLTQEKPPTDLDAIEFHACDHYSNVPSLKDPRVRVSCVSGEGRYVFFREKTTANASIICEIEVYVKRKCAFAYTCRTKSGDCAVTMVRSKYVKCACH